MANGEQKDVKKNIEFVLLLLSFCQPFAIRVCYPFAIPSFRYAFVVRSGDEDMRQ